MKVNFKKVIIKNVEDDNVALDMRKPLGNLIYLQGATPEECKLGRTIYYSDGEVELTETDVETVKRFASTYPYLTREAILELLK